MNNLSLVVGSCAFFFVKVVLIENAQRHLQKKSVTTMHNYKQYKLGTHALK